MTNMTIFSTKYGITTGIFLALKSIYTSIKRIFPKNGIYIVEEKLIEVGVDKYLRIGSEWIKFDSRENALDALYTRKQMLNSYGWGPWCIRPANKKESALRYKLYIQNAPFITVLGIEVK